MLVVIKGNKTMKLYKNEMTNEKYADLAVYCNKNGKVIEDKGDYLEAVNPPEPSDEEKKARVRQVRNQYLQQTDKFMIVDYPIADDERELYKQYRTYLRDYTLSENWWEHLPKDFSTWKEMLAEEEWNKPKEPDPSVAQEKAG